MPVTLQTLATGDTNYVGKHNTNYQNIKSLLDALETQVGSILIQGGEGLAMKTALFGDVTALVGPFSYQPTPIGAIVSIDAGHAWLYDQQKVVETPGSVSFDMTGKSSGTWYVHIAEDGTPSIDTSSTDAFWSFDWDGSDVSNIAREAPTTWANTDWQLAKHSSTLGSFESLDERLEAIEQPLLPAPYDMAGTFAGVPAAGDVILRYPIPRSIKFLAGLPNSQGVAAVAATAETTFDLRKDGVSIGSMVFAASATTATFTLASETSFAAGEVLTVVGPDPADSTLADLGLCLVAERV